MSTTTDDTATTGLSKLDTLTVLLADRCEELTAAVHQLQRLSARLGETPAQLRDAEHEIELLTQRLPSWRTYALVACLGCVVGVVGQLLWQGFGR